MVRPPSCTVCASPHLTEYGSTVVLGRYPARYLACHDCGAIAAIEPSWLSEAYAQAIAATDVGLVDRCLKLGAFTTSMIHALGISNGRFLDWAGGYGLFTRLMRDRGYAFKHYDPYAENLFAGGFSVDLLASKETYDLVTGFEVLEHLEHPVEDLSPVAERAERLLLTTEILPTPSPGLDDWWYFSPETGQHITFYTRRAIRILGERLGFPHVVSGRFIHLFSREPVRLPARSLVARHAVGAVIGLAIGGARYRHSLLAQDHRAAVGSLRETVQLGTSPDPGRAKT